MTTGLQTAFELPFEVSHPASPFFSKGGPVEVIVNLIPDAPEEASTLIATAMHLFVAVANTGALSGERIAPEGSGMQLAREERSAPDVLSFQLADCRVDDRALVPLSDLLLVAKRATWIDAVTLKAAGPVKRLVNGPGRFSTYPGRYERLPFSLVDEEPESGAYTLAGQLNRPLAAESRQQLESALSSWRDFIMNGGFALAPIPPDANYLEPEDPFVDFDQTIEWTVFKLRAHPASIDALINVMAAFSARSQRLVQLCIS
jgi:hypothetical protein